MMITRKYNTSRHDVCDRLPQKKIGLALVVSYTDPSSSYEKGLHSKYYSMVEYLTGRTRDSEHAIIMAV